MRGVPRDVRAAAYRSVREARRDGILVAPARCEDCGPPEAHHPRGYEPEHALDIEWLCGYHHGQRHKPVPASAFVDQSYRDVVIAFHTKGLTDLGLVVNLAEADDPEDAPNLACQYCGSTERHEVVGPPPREMTITICGQCSSDQP